MKLKRQSKILEIIQKSDIDTQEELIEILTKDGFNTTQATISRDIKELKLIKVPKNDGSFKYSVPNDDDFPRFTARLQNIFKECVVKVSVANNLVVVKTLSGLGSAAAMAIDSLKSDEIVGSLAGDDTVFVAVSDEKFAKKFAEDIKSML